MRLLYLSCPVSINSTCYLQSVLKRKYQNPVAFSWKVLQRPSLTSLGILSEKPTNVKSFGLSVGSETWHEQKFIFFKKELPLYMGLTKLWSWVLQLHETDLNPNTNPSLVSRLDGPSQKHRSMLIKERVSWCSQMGVMDLVRGGFASWRLGTGRQEVSAQNLTFSPNFWIF